MHNYTQDYLFRQKINHKIKVNKLMNQQPKLTSEEITLDNIIFPDDQLRILEISEAIHEIDSKLRELELALGLGEFSKKN